MRAGGYLAIPTEGQGVSYKSLSPVQYKHKEESSISSLPVLHALTNPAVREVALFAEYITDNPEAFRKKPKNDPDKPGEYPHALDHLSLETLIRESFDTTEEYKKTRWILYLPVSDKVPPSSVFLTSGKNSKKVEKLPLVPVYVPVILFSYDSFFDLWKNHQSGQDRFIAGDSFHYLTVLTESAVNLVKGGKFKPTSDRTFYGYHASWIPALSPEDFAWVTEISGRMPKVCRYSLPRLSKEPSFPKPGERVQNVLLEMMQVIIRRAFTNFSLDEEQEPRYQSELNCLRFISDLTGCTYSGQETGYDRNFSRELREWLTYARVDRFPEFQCCILVRDPPEGETEPWEVSLFLISEVDSSLIIPAETIWNLPNEHGGLLPPAAYLRNMLIAGIGKAAASSSVLWKYLSIEKPTGAKLTLTEAAEFLGSDLEKIRRKGVIVLLPAWWTDKTYTPRLELHAGRKNPGYQTGMLGFHELLSFDYRIAIGEESYSSEEFWEAVKLKAPFVRIGGRWITFDTDAIQRALDYFHKRTTKGANSTEDLLRLSLIGIQDPDLSVSVHAKDDWVADLLNFIRNDRKEHSCIVPDTFHGILRPYQEEGFSFLFNCNRRGFGACLADDMGLGKTPQTLAWLLYLRELDPGMNTALLVCPMSVVGNWEREINRFAPSLKTWVHHGTDRCKGDEFVRLINSYDLVLTTYHLAARDLDHVSQVTWSAIILDEAQNIKNPHTNQTKAVKSLSGERRVALTGTPVENRLLELWSIMDFLNPGYLGTEHAFTSRYIRAIEQEKDPELTKELRSLISPFILRRMKTDKNVISDLPEKMESREYCTLTKEQATLYQAVVVELAENVDKVEGIARRGAILAAITRLKQICNHPGLITGDNKKKSDRSGKVRRLFEMLDEILAEGDSTLIFSQYATFAQELADMIKKHTGVPVLLLTGSVTRKNREQLIDEFQNSDEPSVFVISLKAGGTGLNLTRATHVFHVDRWWNPAVEDQATDRTYRIGQKRNVQVHLMIAAGTLEERIDVMNQEKRTLAREVLTHGDEYLTNLSTQELLEIVSLRDCVFSGEEDE